ncbi:hypothetical protein HXX76_008319 [Chlamydomonas incerta]|uniref:CSC1/OSCA1-like cytosolic domain-containing protein n=1 Tax=Chlamydomonas incerta TaxID=51695 RepID=A0A835T801_CHLIN|nr:hypothetical protein HXX76_008319 [Chlamydomonas incerta]|eukprot:KAG2433251.1 hypothetical protein HXX76_008319 [Chlamydomonas incerta]
MSAPDRNDTLQIDTLDTRAARKRLITRAKENARYEDDKLEADGLDVGTSYNKVAAYRGVGLGLYYKLLPWLVWMMLWMFICSIPYLIVINTSVFTDEAHKDDNNFGVKMYDSFELASFTFAAIVDDDTDGGLLKYMNTNIADTWKGPMEKGVFLTWISLVDAGATLVLTGVVVWLFFNVDRWLERVDDRTREVADYSIIVGGLPPTVTATEIGDYFQQHFGEDTIRDKVMDVVLVKNLGIILRACKKVHKYEELKEFVDNIKVAAQERAAYAAQSAKQLAGKATGSAAAAAAAAAAADVEEGERNTANKLSRKMSKKMSKTESKIQNQRSLINNRIESGKMSTKAAFVTFNTEKMRINACKSLPSGWWSSWFIRKQYRFPHGGRTWRIWAEQAASPDDYRFENLSVRPRNNILIQLLTAFFMLVFIVICAAFITWLTDKSNTESRNLLWDDSKIVAPLQTYYNSTYVRTIVSAGRRMLGYVDLSQYQNLEGMCRDASLYSNCSAIVNSNINRDLTGAQFNMSFKKEWTFGNASSTTKADIANSKITRLLFERPVRKYLSECSESPNATTCYIGANLVDVSGCLPCYCYGLSLLNTQSATTDFINHVSDTCKQYWQPFDLQRDGIKVAISFVIAIINSILVTTLRICKFYVERHWTITSTELSFAVWTYIVKMINSVAVLLIVNCSTLSKLQSEAVTSKATGSNKWLSNLILNGSYSDFTPEWYESVGFSIMILMMINVTAPFVRTIVEYSIKFAMRLRLLFCHCGGLSAPEGYNIAWRTPQFTLEQRTADILFNLTLALLFGSGMPLCYLICAVYLLVLFWWDRMSLLSLHQPTQRYSRVLPYVIMFFLPVLLVLHCAFGLWMHTYFKAELNSMDLVGAATSAVGNSGINDLTDSGVGARITQPNGLALLIWFIALVAWLLFGRWVIWGTLKLLGNGCARLASCLRIFSSGDGGAAMTYEESLNATRVMDQLRGAATYRIHHLAGYKEYLSGDAGKLWRAAQGQERYTRLTTFRCHVTVETANEDGVQELKEQEVLMFDVAPEVIKTVPKINLDTPVETLQTGLPSAALQATVIKQLESLAAQGTIIKNLSLRPSQVTGLVLPSNIQAYDMVRDGEVLPAAVAVAAAAPLGNLETVPENGPAATTSAPACDPQYAAYAAATGIPTAVSAPMPVTAARASASAAAASASAAAAAGTAAAVGVTAAAVGVTAAAGTAGVAVALAGQDDKRHSGNGKALEADDVKLSVGSEKAAAAAAPPLYPTVPAGNQLAVTDSLQASIAPNEGALYPGVAAVGQQQHAGATLPYPTSPYPAAAVSAPSAPYMQPYAPEAAAPSGLYPSVQAWGGAPAAAAAAPGAFPPISAGASAAMMAAEEARKQSQGQ